MTYKYKKYIKENEEIRCWFKVSANRKKVWNIQLGLIEEVKKICKKYGLRYYADSWTLLWAIRHKWFIPRDDDVDLVMFREDYDKFMDIAPKELPKNYKLQSNFCMWFSKLRNENTAVIDDSDKNKDNLRCISLDIFPLDYMSKYKIINFIQRDILIVIRGILIALKHKNAIKNVSMYKKILYYILRSLFRYANYNNIWKVYDNLCKNIIFVDKSHVVDRWWLFDLYYNTKDFATFKEIEFENIKVCIPLWYDNILKKLYWDYMKPIIFPWGHNCVYSVEKSYKEIFLNWEINRNRFFNL